MLFGRFCSCNFIFDVFLCGHVFIFVCARGVSDGRAKSVPEPARVCLLDYREISAKAFADKVKRAASVSLRGGVGCNRLQPRRRHESAVIFSV